MCPGPPKDPRVLLAVLAPTALQGPAGGASRDMGMGGAGNQSFSKAIAQRNLKKDVHKSRRERKQRNAHRQATVPEEEPAQEGSGLLRRSCLEDTTMEELEGLQSTRLQSWTRLSRAQKTEKRCSFVRTLTAAGSPHFAARCCLAQTPTDALVKPCSRTTVPPTRCSHVTPAASTVHLKQKQLIPKRPCSQSCTAGVNRAHQLQPTGEQVSVAHVTKPLRQTAEHYHEET